PQALARRWLPAARARVQESQETEAGPVGERAAVLVVPAVVVRRQELARQVRVGAVDVDDVETGGARLVRRAHPVVLDAANVAPGHRARDEPRGEIARDLRGGGRSQ